MRTFSIALLACLPDPLAVAGQQQHAGPNRQQREFEAASAQYESGHFSEAAEQLENLLREVPESFEVQELLGLSYSAQSQDGKATPHFEKAVRLKPDSAAARTNLAANLVRLGNPGPAEQEFKQALK